MRLRYKLVLQDRFGPLWQVSAAYHGATWEFFGSDRAATSWAACRRITELARVRAA